MIRVCILVVVAVLGGASARADVLYRFQDGVLFDGRFGPVARMQERVGAALASCGRPAAVAADGRFGPGTRDALTALAECPEFAPKLAGDEDARAGRLTTAYWAALLGDGAPSVDDRARTIMLTYEATDYTRMEWNFCQSRPLYDPAAGQRVCFSNDPKSYLTWGPNGATGGGGREVQLIFATIDAITPRLIDDSFGREAPAVRRMLRLRDRDPARSVETYLCGVWADKDRRASWRTGFDALGRAPSVRAAYDALYKSASLDGGKIATFIRAYAANGLEPTEIDYAFFKDRAAHTGVALQPIRQAVADALAGQPRRFPWQVRQAIALNIRPGSQRTDRLGRDVAFYIDGAGATLSNEERNAWQGRGRLRASDAGLADTRSYKDFTAAPPINTEIASPEELSETERSACPRAVLDTRRP